MPVRARIGCDTQLGYPDPIGSTGMVRYSTVAAALFKWGILTGTDASLFGLANQPC